MSSSRPEPPPEAVLLRLARMASNIRTPVAAAAAGISKARLSQIENGYEKRGSEYRPVSGSDAVIAHLAAISGVTPRQLDEAGRPVAASVLRIILERQQAAGAQIADLRPAIVRDYENNPVIGEAVRGIWAADPRYVPVDQKLYFIERLVALLAGDGSGGVPVADGP